MVEPEPSYSDWLKLRPSAIDWERIYEGPWSNLSGPSELPHHAIVAAFATKLIGGGALLDAGCGDGGLIDYLDLARFAYFGFDRSATATGRARQRHAGAKIAHCTFDEFAPTRDQKFDVVVFNESLQYVDQPFAVIDRFRSFLTPEGIVVVSLFQAKKEAARGVLLARLLHHECVTGRYRLLELAEARNVPRELVWRIFVLK